ncbi:uncharacterized protein LOC113773638 [Coffea eugenioides]|uniref:uncharacterized protein LOC113773638 n=1 Tax=Coffea eugenioides TaxID=49369 RepID=UPI000F608AF9|nr:uncharacterized protein LOC113773638 [Coffea eugenioides]
MNAESQITTTPPPSNLVTRNSGNKMLRFGLFGLFCSLMVAQYIQTISSDEALVDYICSKTPEYAYCQICFSEDEHRYERDKRGLALLAISCCQSQSDSVLIDLEAYQRNSTDTGFKETCRSCQIYVKSALLNILNAKIYCNHGRYHVASAVIHNAIRDHQRCLKRIGSKQIPPVFDGEFFLLKGFYRVARAILLHIK